MAVESNNADAFIGNATTSSKGANAFPISVSSGGTASPTLTTKGELLAQWDFSQMADRTFSSDGNYTVVPTIGKATTATWRFADMAVGLGATGKIRIASGKLEMKGCVDLSSSQNSIWGLNATRTARAANFAIDLRTLSTTLSSDSTLSSHRYMIEVELDPVFSGGNPANITIPTYHQLHYGFVTEMDPLVAGTATQGRHMNMAYHVSTGSTSSTHTWTGWSRTGYNVTTGEGAGYNGSAYSPSKYSNTAQAGGNGYAAEWTVTSPQKVIVQHDGFRPKTTFFPTASSQKVQGQTGAVFHLDRTVNTDTGTTPWFNQSSTNDLWAFFTVFRGFTLGSTTGEYKIKKISIYEERISS